MGDQSLERTQNQEIYRFLRSGSELSLKNGRSEWSEGRNKELRAGRRSKYQQSESGMSLMVWGWQAGLAKVA